MKDALIHVPEANKSCLSDQGGNFVLDLPHLGDFIQVQVLHTGFAPYVKVYNLQDTLERIHIVLHERVNELDEIVIYGEQQSRGSETANSIDLMDSKSMRREGALNLSDGIAKIPGVSQLSTGPGISKPVIRGLFGNRIQTVLFGMRFDNQQWQDEHGLGLSDIGVDRVEVIKGAASLLYGSEAMGGVLNIINEKAAPEGRLQWDASTRYFSNTYGYSLDAGVRKTARHFSWSLRVGQESHADYSDGQGNRILNSRFGGISAKGSVAYRSKHWISENTYLFSQNNFGFIMDAYQLYEKPDERTTRSFERPHHSVWVNLFSSQNTFLLRRSKIKTNLGWHVNDRQEQEGSSGISLDMLLKTFTAYLAWEKYLNERTTITIGSQDQFQTNRNLGSRIIVPDANLAESSLFTYLKHSRKYAVVEGGLRYDWKSIETLPTKFLNTGDPFKPGADIVPGTKTYNTFNGSIGASAFDTKHFITKLNMSSGYRGPNLAELSSNGLHEGSARYEIGDMNLKVEQNLCTAMYGEYYNSWFSLHADVYANFFSNYIYLQADSEEYLGFRIYRYLQKDALIKGLEAGIQIHPPALRFFELAVSYYQISGTTAYGENLPFIPAPKLNSELRFSMKTIQSFSNVYFKLGHTQVMAQNHPGQFETISPAYSLFYLSAGTERQVRKHSILLSVSVNNIFNTVYFDHLSRYKYYGIYNMGRNISLNLKYQFN
ncbi:MAG TPA: TonB-dependent receptor [Bacteroidia bacterium]|nr:TonB-dependent receptor [Bacteroidia bacterium]